MEMQIDARRLKEERNKRAWSQEHLAQVAGLGLRTVQRIESSGATANESIASIATAFGMKVTSFVKKGRKSAGDFDLVRAIGTALPNVKDATSRLGGALKLGGNLLACEAIHKSAEPNSIMVTISPTRRKALLAQNPQAYYLTKHYAPYPAMLVRLARIKRSELKDLLTECHAFMLQQKR